MPVKEFLRSIVPASIWRILVKMRAIGRKSIAGLVEVVSLGALKITDTADAVRIMEKLHFVVPLDYDKGDITMEISTYGEYKRATRACAKEPSTVAWIEGNLQSGDVFFDIGANVGAYSLVAQAHTQGRCLVYAFEPSYATFASLCRNIHINGLQEKIVPLQLALSDATSLLTFKYSSVKPGAAFHSVGESLQDRGPVEVFGWDESTLAQRGLSGFELGTSAVFHPVLVQPTLAYRMDDLISQFGLPIPNVLKIDVDGAEQRVLEGAANIFTSPLLRSVLIEVDPDEAWQLKNWMAEKGFSVSSEFLAGAYLNLIFYRATQ